MNPLTPKEKARTATINSSAVGTWLEPYIGNTVEVTKSSKNLIWFKWYVGRKMMVIERHRKSCFDFIK